MGKKSTFFPDPLFERIKKAFFVCPIKLKAAFAHCENHKSRLNFFYN